MHLMSMQHLNNFAVLFEYNEYDENIEKKNCSNFTTNSFVIYEKLRRIFKLMN